MTKHYLTLALACALAFGSWAKTLTPAEALARAASDNGTRRVAAKVKADPQLVYTASTTVGEPAVYVFAKKGDGYMVLSADDVAYPVLGFADSGTLDVNNMAPAMRWWLDEYARQIAWARERGIEPQAAPAPKAGRRDVPTMLKTSWDQGEPYNGLCPVLNGKRTYTGCVATAMSQIMYYFKYPEVGVGKISYNDDQGCGKRLTWDLADHPFAWDDMLPAYRTGAYDEDQAYAVAELMKSVGAAVRMSYGADASGALSILTGDALVKHFNYDPNIDYVVRSYVSASRWDEMVYNNLANVGPVLYGGASMIGGGHSFVVDGYQAETGLYHFNWGWSELSDGYYALDALNPTSLGAGGGDGGGYNFTQDGVFGIQPPTGAPAVAKPLKMTQQGSLGGTVTDGKLKIELVEDGEPMWVNYTPSDLKVIFGVSVEKFEPGKLAADTTMVPLSSPISVPAGYGASYEVCSPLDLSALALDDGTYKLTMSTLVTSINNKPVTGQEWQSVQENHGYSNSCKIVKTGNDYTVEAASGKFYTVDEIALEYELYYGCLAKFHYKVTNNTDIEISRGIAPILYSTDGQPTFLGNSKMLSLMPGETLEGDIVTEFVAMSQSAGMIYNDTKFYLTLLDETSNRVMLDQILGEVTMHANPGMPSIDMLQRLNIENADYNVGEKCYEVTDPANMQLYAALSLKGGYVAYPIYAVILGEPDATGSAPVIDYVGENLFLEDPEEIFEFEHTYNFKSAELGHTYYMSLALGVGSQLAPIEAGREIKFKIMSYSGVEDVGAAVDAPAEYYNLQGLRVDYGTAPAGIYIRRQGNTATKVMKY